MRGHERELDSTPDVLLDHLRDYYYYYQRTWLRWHKIKRLQGHLTVSDSVTVHCVTVLSMILVRMADRSEPCLLPFPFAFLLPFLTVDSLVQRPLTSSKMTLHSVKPACTELLRWVEFDACCGWTCMCVLSDTEDVSVEMSNFELELSCLLDLDVTTAANDRYFLHFCYVVITHRQKLDDTSCYRFYLR